MLRLRHFLLLLLSLALLPLGAAAERYTVIVSIDGLRADYLQLYDTPFLNQLGRTGVRGTMQPSFPSLTFPNHYTLATGLRPDHHGIIHNTFTDRATGLRFSLGNKATKQDPRFWRGEPVWLTAQRQGVSVGVVYWPGSDVAIRGQYPAYYHDYEQKPLLTATARVERVVELLSLPEAERPRLVMAYFEEPDHSGHASGPLSRATARTMAQLDVLMEQLWRNLQALPLADSLNFIVTADHGMASVGPERVVSLQGVLPAEWTERIDYGTPTQIFARPGCEARIVEALRAVPHVRAWRRADMPAIYHYGTDANVADVVVLPDVGWLVTDRTDVRPGGAHGFDPYAADMSVPFLAVGPDFRRGYVQPEPFPNTAVYPLLCRLLGVEPAPCDGRLDDVARLLASER